LSLSDLDNDGSVFSCSLKLGILYLFLCYVFYFKHSSLVLLLC